MSGGARRADQSESLSPAQTLTLPDFRSNELLKALKKQGFKPSVTLRQNLNYYESILRLEGAVEIASEIYGRLARVKPTNCQDKQNPYSGTTRSVSPRLREILIRQQSSRSPYSNSVPQNAREFAGCSAQTSDRLRALREILSAWISTEPSIKIPPCIAQPPPPLESAEILPFRSRKQLLNLAIECNQTLKRGETSLHQLCLRMRLCPETVLGRLTTQMVENFIHISSPGWATETTFQLQNIRHALDQINSPQRIGR